MEAKYKVIFVLWLLLFSAWVSTSQGMPRDSKKLDRSVPLGQPHGPGYVQRLAEGRAVLSEYVEWAGRPAHNLADSHPRVYCEVLSEFVSYMFEEGASRSLTESAILSFKEDFSWTRTLLNPVWKRLKEWKLREPIEMRQPASEEVTRALMTTCLSWGWWRTGLIIWLAFHCMLRPSDYPPHKWEDIRLIRGQVRVGLLVIKGPKTKKTAARRQHVIIEDRSLLSILVRLLSRMNPAERILPMTYAAFRARLIKLLHAIRMDGCITASSFRAGGATWHWLRRRNFDELRLRGRWLVPKALEVYIQECTSFLGESQLSSSQLALLEALAAEAAPMWREWLDSWR